MKSKAELKSNQLLYSSNCELLILGFYFDEFPILMGDLLISGEESERTVHIPTIGNHETVFPKGSGWVPTGLKQKVNVIGENLAVAWADSPLAARIAIKELQKKNNLRKLSRNDIFEFLNNLGSDIEKMGLSLIVLGIDSDGVFLGHKNVWEYSHPLFGKIVSNGSGMNKLGSFLRQETEFPIPSEGTATPLQTAITVALSVSGCLLQHELRTSGSILNYYGGGYEIVTIIGGKVQKFSDATFVFWDVRKIEEDSHSIFPEKIMKFSYDKNDLLIRTVDFEGGKSKKESIHRISPIHQYPKVSSDSKLIPQFNSWCFCHLTYSENNEDEASIGVIVEYATTKPAGMTIIEEKEKFNLLISKHLLERVVRAAMPDLIPKSQ